MLDAFKNNLRAFAIYSLGREFRVVEGKKNQNIIEKYAEKLDENLLNKIGRNEEQKRQKAV
jgi:hypothetical protein